MNIHECLEKYMNEFLSSFIMSGPKSEGVTKIKVRPVMIKDELLFQATEYVGTKVLHKNYDKASVVSYLEDRIANNFKQCQLVNRDDTVTILVSKKGKITISCKKTKTDKKTAFSDEAAKALLTHNKAKNYLLPEGVAVPFLVDLGVMTGDGKVVKARYDKFKQINRFLEFIDDVFLH